MAEESASSEHPAVAGKDGAAAMSERRVLGLAIPIIGEQLLQTAMSVVDTLIVATLGATALAGVGIASEVVFFMLSIISAVAVGGTVVVSRAIGARDQDAANRLARQTVGWGLVVATPLSILGYMLAPALIGIFRASPDVAETGTTYLRITGGSMAIVLLTFVFGAVLRGAGDGRTPLYASFVANILNALCTWLLVFGVAWFPRLEVAGSAWGSVIGRATGAAILAWVLLSGHRAVSLAGRTGWRPTLDTARSLVQVGVPTALERMVTNAGITSLVLIVALIGTDALAAQQIIFTSFSIALLPGMGFATAATALVGQSIGARDPAAALAATRISIKWSLVWNLVAGFLFLLFARQIMSAFTNDAGVIDHGDGALMALAVSLPAWAFQSVYGGSLRALGDARSPMLLNIAATWAGVVIAMAGVRWSDAGLTFVWSAMAATSPIMALTLPIFRRRLATTRAEIESGEPMLAPA